MSFFEGLYLRNGTLPQIWSVKYTVSHWKYNIQLQLSYNENNIKWLSLGSTKNSWHAIITKTSQTLLELEINTSSHSIL